MKEGLINLTPNDILNKDFNIEIKGYRPQEVDEFLDLIIQDYQEYQKRLSSLLEINNNQSDEITELKKEIRDLKTSLEIANGARGESNSVDILKRLSNLEKIVYGKDN